VNLVLTPWTDTDLYLNFGEGYHSNDARTALLGNGATLLTKALGYEAGARTRQLDGRLDLAAAVWLLDSDGELVFAGDAGTQETGGGSFVNAGPSQRWGVDFESRYQLTRWLAADYDLAFADPRLANGGAVPLAPTLLMNGGLTAELLPGLEVSLRSRYLGDRPANEDRTLIARGYFLLDLIARYRWRNVELSIQALNLTNTDWREAQFADTPCLRSEVGRMKGCAQDPGQQNAPSHPEPPEAITFTPGNPFGFVAGVKLYF